MQLAAKYPTRQHRQAVQAITRFFSEQDSFETVLLVNSCARGKATADSCLDINVLARPEVLAANRAALEGAWEEFYRSSDVFRQLERAGKYADVHLDILDGQFAPVMRDWTGGPDSFELEVGNALAYSVPLWEGSDYYGRLKGAWLPYYGDELRAERLKMVRHFCLNNLDHIPLYVERGLYFQSFDRLYNAYREFLQALFISRRTYPIAYDKWIKEQIVGILGLPELYKELVGLFEIRQFESEELITKAETLRKLFEQYVEAENHIPQTSSNSISQS